MNDRSLFTLSFDDGFKKSFTLAAQIHEEFGLKACLNIPTESCGPHWKPPDEWHNAPTGNWELWNELASRGHEIMPHGYDHCDHAAVPFQESIRKVDLCLDAFEENLKGFKRTEAVFNFPYNSSSPAIEEYVSSKVRAFRTGGDINPLPSRGLTRLRCTAYGPENCDSHLEETINQLLSLPAPGWLIYNAHGFDEEGFGPLTPDFLRRLYDRLLKTKRVEILPTGMALKKYAA